MADWLGQPLMPHQQLIADVGGELVVDDDTGELVPAYREVVVTVPRQNGKTTLVLAWELDRAIAWGVPQRVIYSAQTGQDARSKLLEDQVPMIDRAPRVSRFVQRVNRSKGEESVLFATDSRLSLMASTKAAGHGKTTVGLGVVDEAFDDVTDYREQAMVPAQLTVPDAQLLICSTQGTEESVYLNRKVSTGRAAAAADEGRGIAYFEWSADVEDDPDDPATWWGCMPALGRTITEATVRNMRQTMKDAEFRRACLNIPDTHSEDRPIPSVAWDAVQSAGAAPAGVKVFGVDFTPDRSAAAIVVADGDGHVELVDAKGGTTWTKARLLELVKSHGGRVALDKRGPANSLTGPLESEGVEVTALALEDMAAACGRLQDAIADGPLWVRPDGRLTDAVAGAVRRYSGDVWVWGRKTTLADVSPLVAMTVAYDQAVNVRGRVVVLEGELMA